MRGDGPDTARAGRRRNSGCAPTARHKGPRHLLQATSGGWTSALGASTALGPPDDAVGTGKAKDDAGWSMSGHANLYRAPTSIGRAHRTDRGRSSTRGTFRSAATQRAPIMSGMSDRPRRARRIRKIFLRDGELNGALKPNLCKVWPTTTDTLRRSGERTLAARPACFWTGPQARLGREVPMGHEPAEMDYLAAVRLIDKPSGQRSRRGNE